MAMGLRQRILTLPVMVAFVLSLIWRQIGSVCEAVRVLKRQGMLWTEAEPGLATGRLGAAAAPFRRNCFTGC